MILSSVLLICSRCCLFFSSLLLLFVKLHAVFLETYILLRSFSNPQQNSWFCNPSFCYYVHIVQSIFPIRLFLRVSSAANFHRTACISRLSIIIFSRGLKILKKKENTLCSQCMFITVGHFLFIITWTPSTGNSYTCTLSPYPRKKFL